MTSMKFRNDPEWLRKMSEEELKAGTPLVPLILPCGNDHHAAALKQNKRLLEALQAAQEWMEADGCGCGTDEPGTCALCLTRAALKINNQEAQ